MRTDYSVLPLRITVVMLLRLEEAMNQIHYAQS
jgi:hypothetical protein